MRALRLGIVTSLLIAPLAVQAQSLPPGFDATFASTSIPLELVGSSPVVVRLNDHSFTIRDNRRATERIRRVVTILGPEGRQEGRELVFYDKFRTIRSFEARLLDGAGTVIRRLRRSDFSDHSAIAGFSLYDDLRVRVAELFHDSYPYTVEFEVEVEYSGSLFYPSWYPQGTVAPVEFARFTVEAPVGVPVRFQTQGLDTHPEVTQADRVRRYEWRLAHLPMRRPEHDGPAWSAQMGAVHTAPERFELEGTRGSMASWSGFAAWYHDLTDGRQDLPADAAAEVRRLVAGIDSDLAKVRLLYRFMQERTRYVSVQLGLGGWQPFDARYVHERRYGDCKALTNYMMALLRVAGIEAFPALIQNGFRRVDVDPDFPRNAFNHAILFVPLAADTVWLETTSRTAPFGHIGAGNEDRWALVAREGGGELVRTPRSTAEQNRELRRADVRLATDGNAVVEIETLYAGNRRDHVLAGLADASPRDRERWLHEEVTLPNFNLRNADFGSADLPADELRLHLSLDVQRFASRAGSRLFLQPALMQRPAAVPAPLDRRTQPVLIRYPYVDEDEITFHLPAGFRVEASPEPVELEEAFGRFQSATEVTAEGTLVHRRRLEISHREIPADLYGTYRAFFAAIAQADRAQLVLVPD